MAALSNYLENAIINHFLRNTAQTSPTSVHLALFTTDPGEGGTGTEVSGGSYSRRPVTFVTPTNGTTTNASDITFAVATSDWGTITHLGIYSAATGGEILFHGPFTVAKTIQTGDQFIVRASDLDLTLN